MCIRYHFHEIQQYRFHLWSECESIGTKNMKNFGLYHLMAKDRIHSLLEASIMRAIAIERQVSDDFTRFQKFTSPIPVFKKKKEINKSCRIGPIKKSSPVRHSTLPNQILVLFLVDNLALCTGLITVPIVAFLTALHAARYPASSKTPFKVPLFGLAMLNVQPVIL